MENHIDLETDNFQDRGDDRNCPVIPLTNKYIRRPKT